MAFSAVREFQRCMSDKYESWVDLAKDNQLGVDFLIHCVRGVGSSWLIAAPHGGGIEPGTTEIARIIAGSDYGFYSVEGLKREGNALLHITSHKFDEPQYADLVVGHERVLAIHGCRDSERPRGVSVWVGGSDAQLVIAAIGALSGAGFRADKDRFTPGAEPVNLCNRGARGQGLQFELAEALRSQFFDNLTRAGRRTAKTALQDFATVVRQLLKKAS
jgi:phage replication-related protein YjqB (UPF0714/DUF867 family)